MAEIVPTELKVTEKKITFRFPIDVQVPYFSQALYIKNISNKKAKFSWNRFEEPFSIEESEGVMLSLQNCQAKITYRPEEKSSCEKKCFLMFFDENQNKSYLWETCPPKIIFSEKEINLGLISLGASTTRVLKFKSVGKDDVIYVVEVFDNIKVITSGERVKVR